MKAASWFILPFLAVVLCTVTSAPAQPLPEIRIALLAEFSGYSAEQGKDCRYGFDTARRALAPDDKLDRYQLKYVYEDSQGDPKTALTAFTRLVDIEHVHAVVATRSGVAMALNPVSAGRQIPLLGVVAHPQFVNSNAYAFRFWPSAVSEGHALAAKASELGIRRMAVLTSEDDYTLSLRDHVLEKFGEQGGSIIYSEEVTPQELDFASYIAKLKRTSPGAVLLNLRLGQAGLAARELHMQGFSGQVFGSYFLRFDQEIKAAGQEAVEKTILAELDLNRPRFLAALKEVSGGNEASGTTYTCYASLAALLQTLKGDAVIGSSSNLHAALSRQNSVQLLDEELTIREREAVFPLVYKSIHAGKTVPY